MYSGGSSEPRFVLALRLPGALSSGQRPAAAPAPGYRGRSRLRPARSSPFFQRNLHAEAAKRLLAATVRASPLSFDARADPLVDFQGIRVALAAALAAGLAHDTLDLALAHPGVQQRPYGVGILIEMGGHVLQGDRPPFLQIFLDLNQIHKAPHETGTARASSAASCAVLLPRISMARSTQKKRPQADSSTVVE